MGFTTFHTRFGDCALGWNETGLVRFELPESGPDVTSRRDAQASGVDADGEVPSWVQSLIARVQRHLDGELQDFADTALDWSRVSDFQQAVYRQAWKIKPGFTMSYGDIARRLSLGPEAARAVGLALATNPWPLIVPCHRVISASGKMTGFSGPGGIQTKTRLLALEGAELPLE